MAVAFRGLGRGGVQAAAWALVVLLLQGAGPALGADSAKARAFLGTARGSSGNQKAEVKRLEKELRKWQRSVSSLQSKLGEAEAEVARVEQALRALGVDPTGGQAGAESESASGGGATVDGEAVLEFPGYKVDYMGMLERAKIKLCHAPVIAERIKMVPAVPMDEVEEVSVREGSGGGLELWCGEKGRGLRQVATLSIADEGLYWSCKPTSTSGLQKGLDKLEEWLRTSAVELWSEREMLVRQQFKPMVVSLGVGSVASKVNLPMMGRGSLLQFGGVPDGWSLESTAEGAVVMAGPEASLQLKLWEEARTLKSRWQSSEYRTEVERIERAMQVEKDKKNRGAQRKKELAELKQMKREGLQSDSIDREIAALESGVDAGPAELAECERRLSGLRKELARVKNNSWGSRAAVPYEDLTSTWAELVAGNGIVIYRIDFDK